MEYKFTERTATVFKRFLEVNRPYVNSRMQTINEEESEMEKERMVEHPIRASHDIWSIEIFPHDREPNYDEESQDSDGFIPLVAGMRIFRTKDARERFLHADPLEKWADDIIDGLVGAHPSCKECGSWDLAKDIPFCRMCYPLIMTHTEDCCCCLTNTEGIWVKLPCDHIMHKQCWLAIKCEHESCGCHVKRKCPLCRKMFQYGEAEEC